MKKISNNIWLILILFVFSVATHFAFYGKPNELVFDEVYFGKFASGYFTGNYYFDIHPPLGKLIISGFGYMVGIRADNTDYGLIGNSFSKEISMWYRLLPAIFATLLPLIIFLICQRLKFSNTTSFVAGSLVILENSLIAHSRIISLDSMLLFFGFTSLLLYLFYIKDENKKLILWSSALLAAAAFSIKWTGLAFPLLITILEIIRSRKIFDVSRFILTYVTIGLVFYMGVFAIHFSLLTKPGEGDAFMSQDFQTRSFTDKFVELNMEMYRANVRLTNTHQYSSEWYTWPLMIRSIFYWQDPEEGRYIYLLGNIFTYLLGTVSIILSLWLLVARSIFKRKIDNARLLIVFGFLVNFIPFIFIGRVMFLYHYAAALIFSIIAISSNIEMISNKRIKLIVSVIIILIALGIFLYFSPFTYGLPLSEEGLADRIWFKTWR